MSVVIWVCVGLLGIGLLLLLARMTLGPTVLDRAVAFDVVVAFTLIGVCLHAAAHRSIDNLILLVVLSLLGFVGSVSLARFIDASQVDRSRFGNGDDDHDPSDDTSRREPS